MNNEEQEMLAAAKQVVQQEEIMFQKEQEYQEAYDNFKRAQQALHEAQQTWFKATHSETGILSSMPTESAIIAVFDTPAGS